MISRQRLLPVLAGMILAAISFRPAAAAVFLSGDGNITQQLNGGDAGNQQFFKNILQGGTKVAVLRNTYPGCCETFDEDVSAFYNSLPGVTATTIIGTVTASGLSGAMLFVSPIPDDPFTGSEIGALSTFLNGGGSILFLGENSAFATYNANINSALSALGIAMSVGTDTFESGFVTVSGAQIASNPFTAGVSTFSYAAPSAVVGGTTLFYNVNHVPIVAVVGAVPEPGALSLAMLGIVFACGMGRRSLTGR